MDAKKALQRYFGYTSYRPGQEEIVKSILSHDDVLAIMPTGSGKSICYQLPALLLPGITLVISPLISLMQDQVHALQNVGIQAGYINSTLTDSELSLVYDKALKGIYKIIYVAPERLESFAFLHFCERADISMVTVDEAHCISQWGQDFRPSYLKIIVFIQRLQTRPIVSAFTATATKEVQDDIARILTLQNPKRIVTGFNRENLYFSVKSPQKKDSFVLEYLKKHLNDCGIIYCATRKRVDTLYEKLTNAKISVAKYHAGMSTEERKKSQDDFIYDKVSVIVATNAFGMGIDKSSVRFVIHYNMPQSMENYYQEAGRAGRDGSQAECILLFSEQDIVINNFLLEHKDFTSMTDEDIVHLKQRDKKRLQIMELYCRTSGCLRKYILAYFGEHSETSCGIFENCQGEFTEIDMTDEAKQVINCVWETKGRYGIKILIDALRGMNTTRLRELGITSYQTYGALKGYTESVLKQLMSQLIADGYLYKTSDAYSVIRMGNIQPLKNENKRVVIKKMTEHSNKHEPATKSKKTKETLTQTGYALFELLRKLRLTIAREEGMPPYIIFSDKTLMDMSAKLPLDRQTMLTVSGVGEVKYDKYGERCIATIASFLSDNPDAVTCTIDTSGTADDETDKVGLSSFNRTEYNRKLNKPDAAGQAWTKEEDAQLDREFYSHISISEIAKIHNRTDGAIYSRLRKHGLIE